MGYFKLHLHCLGVILLSMKLKISLLFVLTFAAVLGFSALAFADATLPAAKYFDGKTGIEITEADFSNRLESANVIFLAEEHGNPAIHRWQLELLVQANKLPGGVALSMEQFERDRQPVLNDYLQNRITEGDLLKNGRVWPNYLESYKPLIEYSRTNCIPVIAANLPKDIAKEVSKTGLEFLMTISARPFRLAAEEPYAPFEGKYWEDFQSTMSMHGMPMDKEKIKKFYQAQCLKDDTMAESIVKMLRSYVYNRIVHTNGKFHSDFGLGTVERVRRLMPEANILTVSLLTIDGLKPDTTDKLVKENLTRGEVLVVINAPARAE